MKRRFIILLTILTVLILAAAIHVSYIKMIINQGNEQAKEAQANLVNRNPFFNEIVTKESLGTKDEYYSLYTFNNQDLVSFHTIDGIIQATVPQLSDKEMEDFRIKNLKKYNFSEDSKIMYAYENNLPCLLIKEVNDDFVHNVYFNMLDDLKMLKEYKVYNQ